MSPPGRPNGEYRTAQPGGTPVVGKPAPVVSPCNSVCRIDEGSGWCLGCWRTLEEIAAWSAMADEQKRVVCGQLAARRRSARGTPESGESAP